MNLTPGQQNFIKSLFEQAREAAESSPEAAARAETLLAPLSESLTEALSGSLDKRFASKLIDDLKGVSFDLKNFVPVTEFKYLRPFYNKQGEKVFPISGPDGFDGEKVTVQSSRGERETVVSFLEKVGPNTHYVGLSPKEMKELEAEKKDAEAVKLAERCAALLDRLDVSKLYVAWESTGHNDLAFWQVTEAHVAQVIGGHGRRHRASYEQANGILDRLDGMTDEAIAEASSLYGTELGHCGLCGRELTDESSRERGIGPTCAEKGFLS